MARLYEMHSTYGTRYAYGDKWVAMALYMDDIKFKTPEEAKAWWDNYLKEHPDYESEGQTDVFYGNETENF